MILAYREKRVKTVLVEEEIVCLELSQNDASRLAGILDCTPMLHPNNIKLRDEVQTALKQSVRK